MASVLLTQIRRKQRQLETLRRMLSETQELARLLGEAIKDREPTADESDELARLDVRRDRLEKSISEAGG